MAISKCVHKGCGKLFDPQDESTCAYHPGPPEFHEGQKGWKCCKPRVLTFDEFMNIPPCTTGTHSTTDDSASTQLQVSEADRRKQADISLASLSVQAQDANAARPATSAAPAPLAPAPAPPEDESDDPDAVPPANATCRRRGCNSTYTPADDRSASERCVHHPGMPLFHEGSKGWTCCKRRVLEFDHFLKIEGCKTKTRHCFVGKTLDGNQVQDVLHVRHDFYQTGETVMASLFLKKVDGDMSAIKFSSPSTIELDLRTTDNKRYQQTLPLYADIDMKKSSYKVLGTKVEFTLVKANGTNWAVLRSDERPREMIQTGRAARV